MAAHQESILGVRKPRHRPGLLHLIGRVPARLSFMDVSSHRMTGSLLDALRQRPLFVNGQDQDIGTVGAEIDRLHGQASAQAGRR